MASRAGRPSSSSPASGSGPPPVTARSTTDPILRNALRYTISAREYAALHKYVISRSRALKKRAPTVDTVQRIIDGPPGRAQSKDSKGAAKARGKGKEVEERRTVAVENGDEYNARAIRHSIRVFVATGALMKLWGAVSARLTGKRQDSASATQKKQPLYKSPTLRLSLSLSTILLLYRILFRFFTRLRTHILEPSGAQFRLRNPKTARTLSSPYAPAVGASLAGLALGVYPSRQLRVTIALYAIFRALEFGWNCVEDNGLVWGWERGSHGQADTKRPRPWWWGSWMLQPFAFGQLFHALVFDRDCIPSFWSNFVLKNSSTYLQPKPEDYPVGLKWPQASEIVDSLAQMARLSWPAYISPTLFPNKEDILPASVTAISPITSGAHPLITSLSCATMHPADPSCTRTFITLWLRALPPLSRLLFVAYSATLLLPRLGALYHAPLATLHRLVSSALRMAGFLTGALATAWSSVCFFQTWLPRTFLPTQRFFLGGFLAGLWALLEHGRRGSRAVFLASAKMSVESLWKVGVKRRWWRAMKGGDVWVFVAALMLTGVVYERDAKAVKEGAWRKGISWVRGQGWRDWGMEEDDEDEDGEGRVKEE
ncbi:26ccd84e-468a-4bb8-9fbc-273d5f9ca6d2 [Thermothielavioides terrestris]|uniref:26ccd84e-468a-4bb8-9fbc-273d5f9ca6d2 n=1 Tax=Thermothielavioides terrestris TaxID=2587410 RepID=A0A446BW17_9PEZI|nr:26ccd84e-468a-4bb8-9fbc-273d5f9ca6d2 [Thermothielavioides terrestris]